MAISIPIVCSARFRDSLRSFQWFFVRKDRGEWQVRKTVHTKLVKSWPWGSRLSDEKKITLKNQSLNYFLAPFTGWKKLGGVRQMVWNPESLLTFGVWISVQSKPHAEWAIYQIASSLQIFLCVSKKNKKLIQYIIFKEHLKMSSIVT